VIFDLYPLYRLNLRETRRSLFSNKFNLGRSLLIEVMPKIEKADWYFIIPATAVWALSLLVTAWISFNFKEWFTVSELRVLWAWRSFWRVCFCVP
jgi:hypothetical protein